MRCLKDRELQAHIDGELSDPDRAELDRHLDACLPCRERLARLRSAGERVKAGISSLDPVQIPAPPPLPDERSPRPARTLPFWRKLAISSVRVPAAAVAMAVIFGLGVATGTVLKRSPAAKELPRLERPVPAAGASFQGTVSLEVSSLGLDLEDYRPVTDPTIFTIKE